jgi:hypothetical protein
MPPGRICCLNWRTAISKLLAVPALFMTGGITSGVTYFGIVVGSSVPPGSGAAVVVIVIVMPSTPRMATGSVVLFIMIPPFLVNFI